jgi:hypothetical protein
MLFSHPQQMSCAGKHVWQMHTGRAFDILDIGKDEHSLEDMVIYTGNNKSQVYTCNMKDFFSSEFQILNDPITPVNKINQLYQHIKTQNDYVLLYTGNRISNKTTTRIPVAIYQLLHPDLNTPIWVRPLSEFTDGRFTRILKDSPARLVIRK